MTPHEIIQKTTHEAGLNPLHVSHRLNQHLNAPGTKTKQISDTLMFVRPLGGHAAQVHFVTQDSQLAAIHSISALLDELKQEGIHTIYTNNESRRIMHALGTIGIKFEHSNIPNHKLMAHV